MSDFGGRQAAYYGSIRTVRHDLVKEATIAIGFVFVLVILLSALLSSPNVPSETMRSWVKADAVDFVTTSTGELAGTTTSADYGPPYNHGSSGVQSLGPISPQAWLGVHHPVNSAQDFVIGPLSTAASTDGELAGALRTYTSASDRVRKEWLDNYTKALGDKATRVDDNGYVVVPQGADLGPLPVMMRAQTRLAQTGALDGYLLTNGQFYQTDYTLALMFMGDGGHISSLADGAHLRGDQWGMMNETGSYPGQTWLWLFSFWYQVPQLANAAGTNLDLVVLLLMTLLSLGLLLTPFIPILNRIPYWVPIHRAIWRRYYREEAGRG